MAFPHTPKPGPISYAEGPRLSRAIQVLSEDQRDQFVDAVNTHLTTGNIQSVQMRGQFLRLVRLTEAGEREENYDFGGAHISQSCLTAMTDCFRTHRVPTKVLMPERP
jgi:hypothetical protein